MDFFEIDPFLVFAVAELSPSLSPAQPADFFPLISRLTRPECDEFLLKIVNGEPGAVAALRKRLLSFEKPQTGPQTKPRTFGELLKIAENLRNAAAKRQAEEKRKKHIAEMQELAKRESQTWQEVEQTLASGYTASNYDRATNLLDKLQQLADFQGTQNNFDVRVKLLVEKYKTRTTLIGRWKGKGWV